MVEPGGAYFAATRTALDARGFGLITGTIIGGGVRSWWTRLPAYRPGIGMPEVATCSSLASAVNV